MKAKPPIHCVHTIIPSKALWDNLGIPDGSTLIFDIELLTIN